MKNLYLSTEQCSTTRQSKAAACHLSKMTHHFRCSLLRCTNCTKCNRQTKRQFFHLMIAFHLKLTLVTGNKQWKRRCVFSWWNLKQIHTGATLTAPSFTSVLVFQWKMPKTSCGFKGSCLIVKINEFIIIMTKQCLPKLASNMQANWRVFEKRTLRRECSLRNRTGLVRLSCSINTLIKRYNVFLVKSILK